MTASPHASSQQASPGANNSPEFNEKFQRAQRFVGHKVTITGAPKGHSDKEQTGICTGVVRTYSKDSVDVILADGRRFGLQLDFVGENQCIGRTNTLSVFVRTVALAQSGAKTPKGRVRG